jgi:hypothetical protein
LIDGKKKLTPWTVTTRRGHGHICSPGPKLSSRPAAVGELDVIYLLVEAQLGSRQPLLDVFNLKVVIARDLFHGGPK